MGEPLPPEPASHRTLAIATAVSLAIAVIGLVFVILPASYGIDATGLGTAMGFGPDPEPLADDGVTELTLLVGANRSFTYPFPLTANESVHIVWNSTGPLAATFAAADGEGAGRPVEANWGGNATWQATTFTAPLSGRYQLTWTNDGAEAVTVNLRIAFAH